MAGLCLQVRDLLHDRYRERGEELLRAIEGICRQEAAENALTVQMWMDDQRRLDELEEDRAG